MVDGAKARGERASGREVMKQCEVDAYGSQGHQ